MTITMHTDPLEVSRDASKAGGLPTSKPGSQQDLTARQQADASPGDDPSHEHATLAGKPPRNPRSPRPPPPEGVAFPFMGLRGASGAASPEAAAHAMQQQGSPTAEKARLRLARGIIAVGDMTSTSISRTATALGGALANAVESRVAETPPLSQPLAVPRRYVTRLELAQRFTQPVAAGAEMMGRALGEGLFWLLQAALAVYSQLASMRVLPQLSVGAKDDGTGVPVSPVRGGLPLASDELEAFKLVGAALLLAYVQVYDSLEEAAQLLFRQATSCGERWVSHRHGGEAADVVAAAVALAADLLAVALHWFRLMGRGLLSCTATANARGYLLGRVPGLHLD